VRAFDAPPLRRLRGGYGGGLVAGGWVISMAVFLVARRAWKREAWLLSWA